MPTLRQTSLFSDFLPSWLIPTTIVIIGGLISWQVTLAEVKQELKSTTGTFKAELSEIRSDIRELRSNQLELLRYLREKNGK